MTSRPRGADEPVALTFSSIGRDGREAFAHINIFDLATGTLWNREIPGSPDTGHDCTTASWAESDCVLLPPGDYSVMAFVTTEPAQSPSTDTGRTAQSIALVGDPQVHLATAQQVTLDARRAHRLSVDTPGHPSRINNGGLMQLGYHQTAANGAAVNGTVRPAFLLDNHAYLAPTSKPTIGTFSTLTRVQLTAPDIQLWSKQTGRLHPAYYDAVWFSDFASDFPMYDGQARLGAVDVGQATKKDLRGRRLHGAIAVVKRSDDLSVAEQSNNAAAAGAGVVAIYNDGPGDNEDPNGTGTKLEVPTVRLDRAEGRALRKLPHGARVSIHGQPASPYLYDLVIKKNGAIPADFHRTYRVKDLATQVRAPHGQPRVDSTFSEAAYHFQPGDTFSISTMLPFRGGPRARTEYRIPDPDTRWRYAETSPESSYNALFPHDPVEEMVVSDPHLWTFEAGRTTHLPSLTAPITAAPNPGAPIQRNGDQMRIYLDGFTDAEGNHGSAYSDASGMATHLEIDADGTLVAETDNLPYGYAALPAGDSHVAIHFTTHNPQSWNRLSTHTDTTWAFPTSTTTEAVNAAGAGAGLRRAGRPPQPRRGGQAPPGDVRPVDPARRRVGRARRRHAGRVVGRRRDLDPRDRDHDQLGVARRAAEGHGSRVASPARSGRRGLNGRSDRRPCLPGPLTDRASRVGPPARPLGNGCGRAGGPSAGRCDG